LETDDPELWWRLSEVLSMVGEHEEGIDLLVRATQVYPESFLSKANLAGALIYVGRHEEAWEYIKAARPLVKTREDSLVFVQLMGLYREGSDLPSR
jgi:hypothetical protein